MYSLLCTLCSVQCAVGSVPCTVCSVQYTVYSVQCAVYSVQCAVCSVECDRSLADIALTGGLSPKEEEEQGLAQGKAGRMEKVGRIEGWQKRQTIQKDHGFFSRFWDFKVWPIFF